MKGFCCYQNLELNVIRRFWLQYNLYYVIIFHFIYINLLYLIISNLFPFLMNLCLFPTKNYCISKMVFVIVRPQNIDLVVRNRNSIQCIDGLLFIVFPKNFCSLGFCSKENFCSPTKRIFVPNLNIFCQFF